jgi:hypothetical protein
MLPNSVRGGIKCTTIHFIQLLPAVRNEGFLCVICDASTFLRLDVIASLLFSSWNIAPISAAGALLALGIGGGGKSSPNIGGGAGPGGGRGGGAPLAGGGGARAPFVDALTCRRASAASMPSGFHQEVVFDICAESLEEFIEGLNPLYLRPILLSPIPESVDRLRPL